MGQEFGTDALPNMQRVNVQLLDPGAGSLYRHRNGPDDNA